MKTNGKTKTTKPAAKPADPYHTNWQQMRAFEVKYAKDDIAKAEELTRLLWTKFLDSLSQEQQMMLFACNGFDHMADDFNPRPNPRNVRDQCEFAGGYWTLSKVRAQVRKVQSLLLGREVGTHYEENQRTAPAHKALAEL